MIRMFIMTVLIAMTLSYSNTLSTKPIQLKENTTIVDLWNILGAPDSLNILGDSSTGNLVYSKGNVSCYLLITDLYCVEVKEGKFGDLEIGMKMSKIIKKLTKKYGKATVEDFPTRKFLEYKYGDSNYILSLEFKNKRLTRIQLIKEI